MYILTKMIGNIYIYVVVLICISFITNEVEHIEYHFTELCKPLCHDKAVIHEGEHILYVQYYFWFILLFIYSFIFGCVGSSLLSAGFLQLPYSRSYSSCSLWASRCGGFSCCGAWPLGKGPYCSCCMWAQELWLPGSRAQAPQLQHMGLAAQQHVGSSQVRD